MSKTTGGLTHADMHPTIFPSVDPGGGARGSYEIGVLKYIFQDIPKKYGITPKFQIICGTSVGAFHASYIASNITDIDKNIDKLCEVWCSLKPEYVANFGIKQLLLSSKHIVSKPSLLHFNLPFNISSPKKKTQVEPT